MTVDKTCDTQYSKKQNKDSDADLARKLNGQLSQLLNPHQATVSERQRERSTSVSTHIVVSHVNDVFQQALRNVADSRQHCFHLTDCCQLATGHCEPVTLNHCYTRILHTHVYTH